MERRFTNTVKLHQLPEILEQLPDELVKSYRVLEGKTLTEEDQEKINKRIQTFLQQQKDMGFVFDTVEKRWIRTSYVPTSLPRFLKTPSPGTHGSTRKYSTGSGGAQESVTKKVLMYRWSRR
jgi:hypothetical protein